MIVTVTLNPAVDKTISVPSLNLGEIHRVGESHLDPAGKGINVSRMADRLGIATIAFGFLAGETGQIVARALEEEGVQHSFLRINGQTRFNLTIFDEANNRGTSFFEQGPPVDDHQLNSLEELIRPWLAACKILVLAGSLPLGVPAGTYADYIRLAHNAGIKVILDSADEPLRLGVQACPYLIKPNLEEAEKLLGRSLPNREAVIDAAREILRTGVDVVVISMAEKGSICAENGHIWQATPPKVKKRSTVGSGDSMVAGLAVGISREWDIAESLRLGTAAGAATAMVSGTSLGAPTDIMRLMGQVQVELLE